MEAVTVNPYRIRQRGRLTVVTDRATGANVGEVRKTSRPGEAITYESFLWVDVAGGSVLDRVGTFDRRKAALEHLWGAYRTDVDSEGA